MKFSSKDLAYMALMVAMITVCSWITIPTPAIPFTLQTFAVFAALLLMGGARGTFCVLVYLLLGLVGVPVGSSFNGGPAWLLGPTGGYLIGFLFQGGTYWLFERLTGVKQLWHKIAALVLGLAVCYLFGTLFFTVYKQGAVGFVAALQLCVLPYLLPDAGKMALAFAVTGAVKKALKLA